MSDDFDSNSEPQFTAFVPLLILLIALIIWMGIQVFSLAHQRSVYSQQIQQVLPVLDKAQQYANKYIAVMKDLVDTSAKDQYAAAIVEDTRKAGWIRVNPNGTNTTTTPAAPDATPAK